MLNTPLELGWNMLPHIPAFFILLITYYNGPVFYLHTNIRSRFN